jgi:[glutamine synthetase] adenylyltransferase / [glutamine synthetase]-adenylyl-L-tyrosine phosphorylase
MTDPKPTLEEVTSLLPGVDTAFLSELLEGLPSRYFSDFSQEAYLAHFRRLSEIADRQPYHISVEESTDRRVAVTVLARDYAGVFSILTGLLGSLGLSIKTGDVYTTGPYYGGALSGVGGARRWYRREAGARRLKPAGPRRFIIDRFEGVRSEDTGNFAEEAERNIGYALALLEKNEEAQARRYTIEQVVQGLRQGFAGEARETQPAQIRFDESERGMTRIVILAEDTPFFLYTLSTALSFHSVSIEHVEIRTHRNQVEDSFEIVDSRQRKIEDEGVLNQIRLSVLFTKQFTYFLGSAPDPYQALLRFETMIQDFLQISQSGQIAGLLSSPRILQDLAKLLGTSDFLWEDFIRTQYEELLPLLESTADQEPISLAETELLPALRRSVAGATGWEEKKQALNDFKDHETFLIDLDHILNRKLDFFFLSSRLTALAEAVVDEACRLAWEKTTARYGVPRTVAGLSASYAVFGLGKFGGIALGYASDIELLFVYDDNGQTDGTDKVSNAEFFERMFHEAVGLIETKREGIFQVDLRLRPHGSAGPVAVSLAGFVSYFQSEAVSLERLALVRLRHVAGNAELGRQVEAARDEIVYRPDSIKLEELRSLRLVQLNEKQRPGEINVKFSPGGLADLEYTVQLLQVSLGAGNAALRTPRIHNALDALVQAGGLTKAVATHLGEAYRFFRRLINGLRMLRGNAKDLFLPSEEALEFSHLARRMGYEGRGGLTAAEELKMEFETTSAEVRAFVESQLGRQDEEPQQLRSVADVILSPRPATDETFLELLRRRGFANPERGVRNLRSLAGAEERRHTFAHLAILAWDLLSRSPNPDMALNNWDTFAAELPGPEEHFRELQFQPRRLSLLLDIFASSQFLSNVLIRHPEFFEWATSPAVVHRGRNESSLRRELETDRKNSADEDSFMTRIRLFRFREILRIGTRDICLGVPIESVVGDLSALARSILDTALEFAWEQLEYPAGSGVDPNRLCILAFGKLGGNELNYSSDLDLLAVYEGEGPNSPEVTAVYSRCVRLLRRLVTATTAAGNAYRIDMRLRPFGSAGLLVSPVDAITRYYAEQAESWERQALLKLAPVAGNTEIGHKLLERLKEVIVNIESPEELRRSIGHMRRAATDRLGDAVDVKDGVGGIRDVEFVVQGIQLLRAAEDPAIVTGNTLKALDLLEEREILDAVLCSQLRKDYVFLRRIEHFLQIMEDRQVHAIPGDPSYRSALEKRLVRTGSLEGSLESELEATRRRCRRTFDDFIQGALP